MSNKQTYILPKPNTALMLIIFIGLCITIPVAYFMVMNRLVGLENMHKFGGAIPYVVLPLVGAFLVTFLLRPLFLKKVHAELSEERLSLRYGNRKPIFDGSIGLVHTIFLTDEFNGVRLKLWDIKGKSIITFAVNLLAGMKGAGELRRFANDLKAVTRAVQGQQNPTVSMWKRPGTYYHGTVSGALQQLSVDSFQQTEKKKRGKGIFIGVGLTVLFFVGFIYLIGSNKGFYDREGNTITFSGKVLEGVSADEFENFGYYTAKDCTHVYYKGVIQEGLDAKTFQEIGGRSIYADKNGLYREPTWPAFSGKKLKPVEGVDKASFRAVGDRIFADKDRVYKLDLLSSDPLVPITSDDAPDAPSFKEIGSGFFQDTTAVYFQSIYGSIKRCTEIDRNSFELVTFRVFKDKNNVYFLTHDLEQDGGNKNEEEMSYDILRDADAPSFTKISETEFEDVNTTWTIEQPGERRRPTSTQGRRTE